MQGKWRENLIKIKPYVAGEQSNDKDMIKLNANENPYPPSPPFSGKGINCFQAVMTVRFVYGIFIKGRRNLL